MELAFLTLTRGVSPAS
ncbi:Protein of unknown function [Pyronema omphalodes CBS 100304]|uniref:Uncharacterized protein n=1 Tax=Pyronema omphalodes (strain CBS 100304) TaxID=1076935 RepID=U4LGC3_PYROM|nr:Protein of unknown function [Pyronema omphalodes CBS 100304]